MRTLILACLLHSIGLAQLPDYRLVSTYKFSPQKYANSLQLKMRYSASEVKHTPRWQASMGTPDSVWLVYTQYPKDTANWLTPYSELNGKRLQKLYTLDSRFKSVPHTFIQQTYPNNGKQAAQCYHGIIAFYTPGAEAVEASEEAITTIKKVLPLPDYNQRDTLAYSGLKPRKLMVDVQMKLVKDIVDGKRTPPHPAVLRALERNTQWDSVLVVIDWTGSMYDYGAQVLSWYTKNQDKLYRIVLFNDGDDMVPRTELVLDRKPLGSAGGIYPVIPDSLGTIYNAMSYVMLRGNGGDIPENNIEALLRAHRAFPNHGDVVMIADNDSKIRDFALVDSIDFPVHVIVCDNSAIDPIRSEYMNLAWLTGGSVQTMSRNLSFPQPKSPVPSQGIRFNSRTYYLRNGRLSRN